MKSKPAGEKASESEARTYREHLRHALTLDHEFSAVALDGILSEVASDEGLQHLISNLDAPCDDGDLLSIAWECTKLYATEYLRRTGH